MNRLTGLTLVLLLRVVAVSFGQEEESKSYISKGQWLAGGRLSLSTDDDFENYAFSVAPMGGYFLSRKIAVGLQATYSFNTLSIYNPVLGGVSDGKTRTVGVAPFVRYYFSTKKLATFAEVQGGASWSKREATGSGVFESTEKFSSSFYIVGAGANYFISPDVALEGVLRYTDDNAYSENYLDFDLGLQFFFSKGNPATADEGNYFSKGHWLIGGTGNVSLGQLDDIDPYLFSISPLAGYLVGNKLAFGLSTAYTHIKKSSDSFFAAPFLRYYFTQKKLAPYAEVAYGGSWTRVEYRNPFTNEDVVDNYSSTSYRFGAGLNYFISKNVALDGRLGYSKITEADFGTLSFSAGLQFFIR